MKTCCFIGHREVKVTEELLTELKNTVKRLVEEQGVKTFIFGSASKFDELCLTITTELKQEFPEIELVYFRASYSKIDEWYRKYLLESYDDTLMPCGVEKAGRASYVKRNEAMINASDFCVFYYDENYLLPMSKRTRSVVSTYQPQSGTRLAYCYALKKNKTIINLHK